MTGTEKQIYKIAAADFGTLGERVTWDEIERRIIEKEKLSECVIGDFGHLKDEWTGEVVAVPVEPVETKLTIESAKETFWTSWERMKACRGSKSGQHRYWQNAFEKACHALNDYTEAEIRKAFDVYADFALSKR